MGRKKLFNLEDVHRALEYWFLEHGHAPTIRELTDALGVGSTRTTLRYLEELEHSGIIERWGGTRGIRLLKRVPGPDVSTASVPLLGTAPAGPLLHAEENTEGHLRLPKDLLSPAGGSFFLLRVHGRSMNRAELQGDRIESGDLLLVRQQPEASDGEIVVVMLDGEVTVKRLRKTSNYWFLKPESTETEYEPIIIDADFRIQGVVTRVIKGAAGLLDEDTYT